MVRLRVGPVSFIIDWMYGRIPGLGWLLNRFHPIYVYNKPARYKFLDELRGKYRPAEGTAHLCLNSLELGRHIALFPEGKRNRDPVFLMRGRMGAARIAQISGVPIVPVGIDFTARLKRGRVPVIGKAIFRVGKSLIVCRDKYGQYGIPSSGQPLSTPILRDITSEVMDRLALLSGKFRRPENPAKIDK